MSIPKITQKAQQIDTIKLSKSTSNGTLNRKQIDLKALKEEIHSPQTTDKAAGNNALSKRIQA